VDKQTQRIMVICAASTSCLTQVRYLTGESEAKVRQDASSNSLSERKRTAPPLRGRSGTSTRVSFHATRAAALISQTNTKVGIAVQHNTTHNHNHRQYYTRSQQPARPYAYIVVVITRIPHTHITT
jgi:hypothetical protein